MRPSSFGTDSAKQLQRACKALQRVYTQSATMSRSEPSALSGGRVGTARGRLASQLKRILLFGGFLLVPCIAIALLGVITSRKADSDFSTNNAAQPAQMSPPVEHDEEMRAMAIANGAPPEALRYRSQIRMWAECVLSRADLVAQPDYAPRAQLISLPVKRAMLVKLPK